MSGRILDAFGATTIARRFRKPRERTDHTPRTPDRHDPPHDEPDGHEAPNLIGVDMRGVDRQIATLVPGYDDGPGRDGDMMMQWPRNSISRMGGKGPFAEIESTWAACSRS